MTLCFKYLEDVTECSASPPVSPVEPTGQHPAMISCEAMCKITFTEQSLVSSQVISHSVENSKLPMCPNATVDILFVVNLDAWQRDKKTNMKSNRRMATVFRVSWCHRSSALHRSDLIIINITLMTTIRQSSAHVNHSMVYKRGYYSALSAKGKRWVQQSKLLLGVMEISQNDHKCRSFFSIHQHLSAIQQTDCRYMLVLIFQQWCSISKMAANLSAHSLWVLVVMKRFTLRYSRMCITGMDVNVWECKNHSDVIIYNTLYCNYMDFKHLKGSGPETKMLLVERMWCYDQLWAECEAAFQLVKWFYFMSKMYCNAGLQRLHYTQMKTY